MTEKNKRCKVCCAAIPIEHFKSDRRSVDNLAAICNSCLKEREEHIEYPALHEQMLVEQGQRCVICKSPVFLSKILVDRDHKTDEVLGLVCRDCNRALRELRRDPIIVKSMLVYLAPKTEPLRSSGPPMPVVQQSR